MNGLVLHAKICCCGGTTCTCYPAIDDLPAVSGPQQLSLSVSISGVTIVQPETYTDNYDAVRPIRWDVDTIDTTVCCFPTGITGGAEKVGCPGQIWRSTTPAITGHYLGIDGAPDVNRPVAAYLLLTYEFGNPGAIHADIGSIGLPDHDDYTNASGGSQGVIFTDVVNEETTTTIEYPRGCDRSGSIDNAIVEEGDGTLSGDTSTLVFGYGGNITIGGDCGLADCSVCDPTSLAVDVETGPAYTGAAYAVSGIVTKVSGCGYTGTATDSDGHTATLSVNYDGTRYTAGSIAGAKVFSAGRLCDGSGDPTGVYEVQASDGSGVTHTVTVTA